MTDIGIVGTGSTARALACDLVRKGHRVRFLTRNAAQLGWLAAREGTIHASGKIEGAFTLAGWGDDPATFCASCSTIVLATVVIAYPAVVARLAPHLRSGQRLICFSAKLGGALEVARCLAEHEVRGVDVVETDALFACRTQEDGSVWVRGIKRWTLFSGPTRKDTERLADWMRGIFPGLDPADHAIQRGLTDFGALAHAPTMLANMTRVDRGEPFLFYYEGFTERTVVFLEQAEREFRAIAHAYETELVPMARLLDRYYGCDTSSLLAAMRSVPNYRHSMAPRTLDHRYMREDVCATLVPARELARVAGVPTPTLDAIAHLASILLGCDLEREGRTLARLGLSSLSRRAILARLRG